jgi:signal transduction histidine kinase
VHLRALASLRPVVAAAVAALGRALQRAAVEDRRRRLLVPAIQEPQDAAQVLGHRVEHARRDPPLRLLVHGRPRRQVVGHHPPSLAAAHDVTHAVEYLAQVVLTLRGVLGHERQVGRHEVPLLVRHVAGVRLPCHASCTAGSSREFRTRSSERAARVEAERASEAKSEFLATLSHELRTPLTPVMLTVSLIESHPALHADLRADVATIRRNVELESRLISDLLDLTRIERGKLQLDEQYFDLHLIVRSAIDICQREASAKLTVDLGARSQHGAGRQHAVAAGLLESHQQRY